MTKSKPQTEAADQQPNEFKQELEKAINAKMQVMADFENYRRRTEAEKAKFGAIANRMLLEGLMEITDDISLASRDPEMSIERAKEMLSLLSEKISSLITQNSVEKIQVTQGDAFDPNTMEAITVVPVEQDQDGKVVEIISSGYRHSGGELIRSAKVIIGRHSGD